MGQVPVPGQPCGTDCGGANGMATGRAAIMARIQCPEAAAQADQVSATSRSAASAATSLCHSAIQSSASLSKSTGGSPTPSFGPAMRILLERPVILVQPAQGTPAALLQLVRTASFRVLAFRGAQDGASTGRGNQMAEQAKQREGGEQPQPPVVIKKYANRRLYNTEASSYVTLEDLAGMVRAGRDFAVYDAKSGDEITRAVLTQIIVEEESKGQNLLPVPFLRQLIGLYGNSVQSLVPRYLEVAMGSFARQQEQIRQSVEQTIGGFNPFGNLEEVGKQNMAMMERAMSLFSPFPRKDNAGTGVAPREAEELERLRNELAAAHEQLARLRQEAGKG
jgi:polyhydroxyalkanoate synthesis repressor PhaR